MIIHELANDPLIRERVCSVARAQMKRRGEDYKALAIFESDDLSQQVWLEFLQMEKDGFRFGPFVSTEADTVDLIRSVCERVGRRGSRKRGGALTVTFTDLSPRDKRDLGIEVKKKKRKRKRK